MAVADIVNFPVSPQLHPGLQTWLDVDHNHQELVSRTNARLRQVTTDGDLLESVNYQIGLAAGGYTGEMIPLFMAVIIFRHSSR